MESTYDKILQTIESIGWPAAFLLILAFLIYVVTKNHTPNKH